MLSRLRLCAFLLLVSAAAYAVPPAPAWADGASRTIYYTPGGYLSDVYVSTNLDYISNRANSISIVSGSLPGSIGFYGDVNWNECNPACAYFYALSNITGTATYSVVVRVTKGAQSADITVNFQPDFSLPGAVTSTGIVGSSYSSSLTASGGTSPRSYSISTGSLPPGLALNSSSGNISGTPTTAGSYAFVVRATDASSLTALSAVQGILIYGALSVTTSSLPATTAGASYSQTLASTGGTTPKTWSLASGSLPSGLSMSSGGVITGTASSAGSSSFSAQVACCSGATAQSSLSILVNAAPSVTTGSLPSGAPSVSYSQSLGASGGTGSLTWSISSGSLPTGLSLNSSTGAITGTPTTVGSYSFTARATDSLSIAGTQSLSIQIVSLPSITTSSISPATAGQSFSTTMAATSGTSPYTWTLSAGSLPSGVTLNSSSGALSGTPAASGTFSFTVKVTDAASGEATQAFSWTVNAALAIPTTSLPATTIGAAYSQTLSGSGGVSPLTWAVSSGSLPSGLSLNTSSGAISGTSSATGAASFTVSLTDANSATTTQGLAITVNAAPGVTTTSLPPGVTTVGYSQTLAGAGGTGSLTWSVTAGSLPAGLSLNTSTGAITGTPTATGTASFTVHAADSLSIGGSGALSIQIVDQPSITTSTLTPITVGHSASATVAASLGTTPYVWSVSAGSLPSGISLNTSTGALTGTPSGAGSSSFTIKVTDASSLEATQAFSWTVNAALSITTTSLPSTTLGAAYSQSLAGSGGTGPLVWSISSGSLPSGLSLNSSTGAISGTSTSAGASNFTISLTDANGATATQAFTITGNAAPAITTSTLPFGVTASAYSQTLTATGGTGALTWSISSGALPVGLSLNSSSGAITGTPTATGTASFTVLATDSVSIAGTRSLSILIVDLPSITTTTLAPVTTGHSVSTAVAASAGTTPYTWSVSTGSLPSGISLNASTGTLTGTPSVAGSSSFTVKVTDASSLESTHSFSWIVNSALSVTTLSLPATTIGAAYSQTLAGSGGTAPLTWTVTAGSLPSGLTLNASTAVISGTTSSSGAANFTVTLTDANSATATQALMITVNAVPSVTTTTLPFGITAATYTQTLAGTGGTGSLAWSISSGALPAGLSLNPSSGQITGMPSATGTASFTARTMDTAGIAGSRALSIQIVDRPSITTTTLAPVTAGHSVSATVAASAGTTPYTWAVSAGSLPPGINLNSSTGALTGTPSSAGASSFTIKVTDASSLEATQALSWTVNTALSITTSSLPATTAGAVYSPTLANSGGTAPLIWAISTGSLPSGLSLNSSTGAITGISTAAGSPSFTILLSDANSATATHALTITVNAAPSVTTTTLPFGVTATAYSQTLSGTGGTGAHTWSISSGALPAGLSLNASSGAITGTPTATGTASFTVQAVDSLSIAGTRALWIQIVSPPSITTTTLAPITAGHGVATTVAASAGTTPYVWSISAGSLPAGVTLNSSSGALTGTPSAASAVSFTVKVTDANSLEATRSLSWTVNAAPSITTSTLPATTSTAVYSQTLAATGGTTPLAWALSAGSLPGGLSLNASTGAITGSSSAAGASSFTVSLTDANGAVGTQALAITVNAAPSITTTTLSFGVTAVSYARTLAATGGTGALTWSVSGGTLPAGLSLNASSGAIIGTPTATGTANFTVHATDTLGVFGAQTLALQIFDPPSITTTTLAPITAGHSASTAVVASAGTAPYVWSISAGSLPAGISLNASTGALTGTPAAAANASFTVKVTDANSLEHTRALTWTVNAAPSITTASLPATTVGAAYSQTLAGTGGTGSLTWSVSTGNLPAGITLDASTGVLSGTSTTSGAANVTVTITDTNSATATHSFVITVNAAPAITTSTLPFGVTTIAYSQTAAATGGTGALTWSISAGNLPAGLNLNASTGAITGTPTATGTASFTIQATDTLSIAATRALTLQIFDQPAISTSTLAPITIGHSVSTTIAASLGATPYQWTISAGTLPTGLSLNASTGALTGTPTAAGPSAFTIKVTDAHSLEDTQAITWTVNAAPSITTTSLPATTLGATYSQTLTGTGGTSPVTWSVSTGALPAGLSLNAASGAITGTTTATATVDFTISYTDANSTAATHSFSLAVNAAPSITTSTLPRAVTTVAYSQALASTGGTGALAWSVSSGTLPAGLTLNASTGAIAGTPSATGTASFTIQAADPLGINGTQALSIEVVNQPTITTDFLSPITVGRNINRPTVATAGTAPYQWSVSSGSLPTGITLNPTTGALSGTASSAGTFAFTLHVADVYHLEDTQTFNWQVTSAPPEITGDTLPVAYVGTAFWFPLTSTGGTGTRTWSLASGSLPAGLSLMSTGSLEGTPTAAGTANFVVQITDGSGAAATQSYALEVKERPRFRASPDNLKFSSEIGGPTPVPQQIEIVSTPAGSTFTATADGTTWLRLTFDRSTTPAVLGISAAPGDLAAGTYAGLITITGDETRVIAVALQVNPRSEPALIIAPEEITIGASSGNANATRLITAHINGPVAAITAQSSAAWLTVSGPTLTNEGHDAGFSLSVDSPILGNGTHEASVAFSMGGSEKTVPVRVTITPVSFALSQSGLTFDANVNGAGVAPQVLSIANGNTSSLHWAASAEASWIRLNPPTGVAEPLSPLEIQINTTGLAVGAYSTRVGVTPQSGGEAHTLDVRLNVTATDSAPQVAPLGLLFRPTSSATPPQQILLSNPGGASISYTGAVSPASAATWLTVGPLSGSIGAGGSTLLTAQVQKAGLNPGIYNAALTIEFADQTIRVVQITLAVAADSCKATRLVPVITKLGDHFDIRAGWPAPVEILVADDCGQPVSQGAGLLQFSDPDEKALALLPSPNGVWTATWIPAKGHESITVNATLKSSAPLQAGSAIATGIVRSVPATQ